MESRLLRQGVAHARHLPNLPALRRPVGAVHEPRVTAVQREGWAGAGPLLAPPGQGLADGAVAGPQGGGWPPRQTAAGSARPGGHIPAPVLTQGVAILPCRPPPPHARRLRSSVFRWGNSCTNFGAKSGHNYVEATTGRSPARMRNEEEEIMCSVAQIVPMPLSAACL
jgi:hypothetical protein